MHVKVKYSKLSNNFKMLLFEFICILWMSSSITGAPVPDEVVDMSYSYDESTLGWPGQRKFRLKIIHNGTAAEGYWFQAEEFVMATHIGTHLDAPCHFAKGKWSVEELPLNHLMAPAAVIDISNKSEVDNDTLVQIQDLEKWERLSGQSLDATIVLIRSGWGTHWPDKKNFTGTIENGTDNLHFPGISKEAAQWLVDNRSIYGIGIDTLSLDNGPSKDYMAHRILLGANVFGLENVANMDEIPIYGANLYVFPMKLSGSCGAPVRIIATYPKVGFSEKLDRSANEDTLREIIIFTK